MLVTEVIDVVDEDPEFATLTVVSLDVDPEVNRTEGSSKARD
jgi:hypothetical protein